LDQIERVPTLPSVIERPADAHKGTFGRALIIGGSRGMSGAPALAGLGALRSGAGLVFVACPDRIVPIVAGIEPSYLTVPLPEDAAGRIASSAKKLIDEQAQLCTALAIGPGMGQSTGCSKIVLELFQKAPVPALFDADALNALAAAPKKTLDAPSSKGRERPPRILTPHPGEFARLIKMRTEDVAADRESLAVNFARSAGVILVLKGQHTMITDGKRMAVNATGNSGMATGGTGDVLTGVITGLLAQGMPAFEAAQLGVHWHGLAGDLAAAELSEPSLIASDLPRYLGKAWRELPS
jgi:ADP-dependent NAD(P)H-hydrate dehydratase